MASYKNPLVKRIASERIQILYNIAEKEMRERPELARRYAKLIKKIGMHYRVGLPKMIKDRICKRCNSILIPGLSVSVRLSSKNRYIVYRCLNCNLEKHLHY